MPQLPSSQLDYNAGQQNNGVNDVGNNDDKFWQNIYDKPVTNKAAIDDIADNLVQDTASRLDDITEFIVSDSVELTDLNNTSMRTKIERCVAALSLDELKYVDPDDGDK